jgi:hypothetical protein
MLVAIPTAMPWLPLTSRFGNRAGQHEGLLEVAVVVGNHVDGVLVDVGEQLHRQRIQAAFGVAGGGRPEVGAAVVAVEVDQGMTQRERLGHAHEGVVDGAVAVRVEARHGVAGDAGALDVGAVGAEALVLHVPDDPAVHGLEAVAHVGERTRHDDRHRVFEERVLHLLVQRDGLDGVDGRGVVGVGHVSSVRSRGCVRRGRWW